MVVKNFTANDMKDAMNQVRLALGPNALILSSKQERLTWYQRLFRRPRFEIIAGVEDVVRGTASPQQHEPATTREAFEQSMLVPLCREIKALKEQVDSIAKGSAIQAAAVIRQHEDAADTQALHLAELAADAGAGEGVVRRLSARLVSSGVTCQLAEQLATGVAARIGAGAGSEEQLKALAGELSAAIKCSLPLKKRRSGPRIIVLVGPTGVGKTTTVAKLASSVIRNEQSVAMIAADTFRVGAVDQLRTYSKIMGVQMESAGSPTELAAAVNKLAGFDFIFIDTSGRSPRDADRIDEIKALLSVLHEPDIHLCLASTTRDEELTDILARFSTLALSRVIFTKMDEGRQHGGVVNALFGNKLGLAYFTTGQNVPDDIEPASIKKLARMLLEDGRR